MANRSGEGFGRFYADNLGFLRRLVARRVNDRQEVEDVVQESFARLLDAMRAGRAPQPQGYLVATARSIMINHLRRQKVRAETSDKEELARAVSDQSPDAERQMIAREQLALLREAFAQLSPIRQQIIVLRQVEGLSYKEIADRTGLSISSIEKHVRAALLICKAHLRDKENADQIDDALQAAQRKLTHGRR